MSIEDHKVLQQNSRTGRLLQFRFHPPRLGPLPPKWVATEFGGLLFFNRFAIRLAKTPPDLVTRLGVERSNAYYAAGCPLELCDHAAARDLWQVIHQDVIASERRPHAAGV